MALLALLQAHPTIADDGAGKLTFQDALALASRCVLKIADDPADGKRGHGSAVILDIDDKRDVLTLATCAHVVIGLDNPRVLLNVPQQGEQVAGRVERGRIDPEHDLAVLEATWTGPKDWLGLIAKAPPIAPLRADGKDGLEGVRAFAAGYARYRNAAISAVDLRLGGLELAPFVVPLDTSKPRTDWQLRLATLSATAKGMSGGIVITEDGRFAGLIIGRVPDTVTLINPAARLEQGRSPGRRLAKYPDLTRDWAQLPYVESTKDFIRHYNDASALEVVDSIGWKDLSRLTRYFQDPGSLREPFQEISVHPSQVFYRDNMRQAGEGLMIVLDQACFDGAPDETVSVWVNGHPIYDGRPDEKKPAPVLDLSADLVPGENLVILRKKRGQSGVVAGKQLALDRTLLGLTTDSRLVATLTDRGSVGTYRIERSLPGLVDGFAIYVTVLRPADPVSVDVRLEAELSWLATLISARPITWALAWLDPGTGSLVRGRIDFPGGPGQQVDTVRLAPWTPAPSQSLGVEFPADIKVDELFLNFFGVQIREESLDSIRVNIKGRIQWVQTSPKVRAAGDAAPVFAVCARVVSGRNTTRAPVQVRLGELKLGLDMAPALQELAVNHVNNRYLQPDQPRGLVQQQLREFFRDADLVHGPGGAATPTYARVEGGWLKFGFTAGGRSPLPAIAPRSAEGIVRLEARSVALGSPRINAVLGDRLPGEFNRVLGKGLDDVSGIAIMSRGGAPAREPIRLEGNNFDPVATSYRGLWEGQVQKNPARLALRVSKGDLERILPGLFEGYLELKGLVADRDAFVGDPSLFREIGAGPFEIQAKTFSTLPRPEWNALPLIIARGPKLELDPVELVGLKGERNKLVVKGTLAVDELTAHVDAQRQWVYRDVHVGFRFELPGVSDEQWALTIQTITGTQVETDFPLSKLRGKTFVQGKHGLQRRPG